MLAACRFLTGKYKDSVGQKAHRLSSRIDLCENHGGRLRSYICRWKKSLGDSRIKRVRDRIAILSMPTVRVVVLEKRLRTYFVSLEALKMYCYGGIRAIRLPTL